ncbi:MAG: methyltransferase domain-containing protein [Blastochloris sp.]|nr:methyltransferase domain-containing protein [Blastochloris sp.]
MLARLPHRSFSPDQPEQMDQPNLDPQDLAQDLHNLETINRFFGGRHATRLISRTIQTDADPAQSFIDCACGAGDLSALLATSHPQGKVIGLDLHPQTLDYARQRHHLPNLSWQQGDIKQLPFPDHSMDVVTCQLALHHFSDDDAVLILRELLRVSRRWVFVTDLERSSLGYAGVWLLVHLWLRHPMTRHDALLSVRRSFTAPELRSLAQRAHWPSFQHRSLPWHRQLIYLNKAHHAV